ncbi:MAG: hypothetical protein AAF901_13390, partial [Bacteroidota bacterium]
MKYYILSLLLISGTINLYSQSNQIEVPVPPAPNAASLGQYGDIPVGESSGTANVSIPIHSVATRAINVPINLNYHTNGIRVAEEASLVGLGWSLNAGGMITRTVRGFDDFGNRSLSLACSGAGNVYDNYWDLANSGEIPMGPVIGPFDNNKYIAEKNVAEDSDGIIEFSDGTQIPIADLCQEEGTAKDMESDLYSFNLPGLSGKFIIDGSGAFRVLSAAKISIEIEVNAYDDVRWVITSPNGTKYYLGQDVNSRQLTYQYSQSTTFFDGAQQAGGCIGQTGAQPDSYIGTWYLDKIVAPLGGDLLPEEVFFEYKRHTTAGSNDRYYPLPGYSARKMYREYIEVQSESNQGCASIPELEREYRTISFMAYDNIYLDRIHAPTIQEEVLFSIKGDRADLKNGLQLDQVLVKRNGQSYRQVDLSYEFFNSVVTSSENKWVSDAVFQTDGSGNPLIDWNISTIPDYAILPDFENKRLKLRNVDHHSFDGSAGLSYSLNYYEELPTKTSYSTDYWGFYNGVHANEVFYSNINGQVLYYPDNLPIVAFNDDGADRSVNDEKVKGALLQSITYPTGGHTNF